MDLFKHQNFGGMVFQWRDKSLRVKMPLSSGFGTTWECVIIDKIFHVWVNYPFKTPDMIFITKLISTN